MMKWYDNVYTNIHKHQSHRDILIKVPYLLQSTNFSTRPPKVDYESRKFVPLGLSWLSVYIPHVFHKTGNAVMEIRIQTKRHKGVYPY